MRPILDESLEEKCPFCGLHPFEYVDIGIGMQAIAVNCCEEGYLMFDRGWSYRKIRLYMVWNGIRQRVARWLWRMKRILRRLRNGKDEWDF